MSVEELRERFLRYLEQNLAPQGGWRRLWIQAAFLGLGLLMLVLSFARGTPQTATGGGILLLLGAYRLSPLLRNYRYYRRARGVLQSGIPVQAVVVQANRDLFQPGTGSRFSLVLFSFEETPGYLERLRELARRMGELKGTQPSEPDLQEVSRIVDASEQRGMQYRRRRLPLSFTGGAVVYVADLVVVHSRLRQGYLDRPVLLCLAEPGDEGGLEQIPDWLLDEARRRSEAAREQEEAARFQERESRRIGFQA
jgi:hypothetical protein